MSVRPELLRADNLTPSSRTPWGGRAIIERFKPDLGPCVQGPVGESWEVSVEPSFPSRLQRGGGEVPLSDVIARDPVAWLGRTLAERHGQTTLLIKLLDAGDDLSLQVHPAWDDPALADGESGKCESWVILDAQPGCGIYLGFRDGVGRDDVRACIEEHGPLDDLMNFVTVRRGDVFSIRDGTPHAVGRGVTLFEPQAVLPGRRGVTYRYWDWNRRYDERGNPDPAGHMRELHLRRSLEATRWDAPRGAAFVDWCREPGSVLHDDGALRIEHVLRCPWYEVTRVTGTGRWTLPTDDRMVAVTCVEGEADARTGLGDISLAIGTSGVIPAAARDVELTLRAADLFVVQECC